MINGRSPVLERTKEKRRKKKGITLATLSFLLIHLSLKVRKTIDFMVIATRPPSAVCMSLYPLDVATHFTRSIIKIQMCFKAFESSSSLSFVLLLLFLLLVGVTVVKRQSFVL